MGQNSKKKILVVDDSEMVRNFHSSVEPGPSLHMVKPTDPEKLITTIKMLL